MADTTVTVNSGGGADYTTVQAAIDASDVSTGFFKVEIQNNATYTETITAGGSTGTPTIANYLWITAIDAAYHGGDTTTGAKVQASGNNHTFTCSENFVRFEKLRVGIGTGISNESFRINSGITDLLVERCILDGNYRGDTDRDKDGFFTVATGSPSLTVYNTVIFNYARANIHWDGANGTCNAEFVTSAQASQDENRGNFRIPKDTGLTVTTNIYNCVCADSGNSATEYVQDSGTHTNNGSHNAADDTSGGVFGTNAVNSIVITDAWTAPATFDYTIKDASSALYQAGTDRSGSKPDSRVDATIDIAGTTRPATPSIGAYEFVAAGPDRSITADQDAFLATQSATLVRERTITADQDAFLPTQAAALTVRNDIAVAQDAFLGTQAAPVKLIVKATAAQDGFLATQAATLGNIAAITAAQDAFLATQAATFATIIKATADQTAFLATQSAALANLIDITAAQDAFLATQSAALSASTTRTITAAQDAFLATQAATAKAIVKATTAQTALLATQSAALKLVAKVTSAQSAFLATQSAALTVVAPGIVADHAAFLATQSAPLKAILKSNAAQSAFLPTQQANAKLIAKATAAHAAFLATQSSVLIVGTLPTIGLGGDFTADQGIPGCTLSDQNLNGSSF